MEPRNARSSQFTNIQVPPSRYFRQEYDHRARFLSYWHQINEIWSLAPRSVLEIGIGNSLVADYLRKRGLNILTLDIDANLRPDCAGSVLQIPFSNGAFEVATCYEVLEHLPFEVFPVALSELHRVSSQYVIISVPDHTPAYRLNIQVPKLGEIKKLIVIPKFNPPKYVFNDQHYWEMGKAGYSLGRITTVIKDARFDILKSHRIFESPKYHFFVLTKRRLGTS
jgi:hypothetical protein